LDAFYFAGVAGPLRFRDRRRPGDEIGPRSQDRKDILGAVWLNIEVVKLLDIVGFFEDFGPFCQVCRHALAKESDCEFEPTSRSLARLRSTAVIDPGPQVVPPFAGPDRLQFKIAHLCRRPGGVGTVDNTNDEGPPTAIIKKSFD
jgi:hypothetical protein